MIEIRNIENGEIIQIAKKDLPKILDWYSAKRKGEKKEMGL